MFEMRVASMMPPGTAIGYREDGLESRGTSSDSLKRPEKMFSDVCVG